MPLMPATRPVGEQQQRRREADQRCRRCSARDGCKVRASRSRGDNLGPQRADGKPDAARSFAHPSAVPLAAGEPNGPTIHPACWICTSPARRRFRAPLWRRALFAWLMRLRWYALLGIVVATLLAAFGRFPGVNWQVLAVAAAVAALYNATLARAHRDGRAETGPRAALTQALGDFLLLTVVLWASGGVRSPFIAYYAFHVALAGIIAGPRATLVGRRSPRSACGGFLALGELYPDRSRSRTGACKGRCARRPTSPRSLSTVAGIAYIVTHAVVRAARSRRSAGARARSRAPRVRSAVDHAERARCGSRDRRCATATSRSRIAWRKAWCRRPAPGERWHCPGGEHHCERDVSDLCPVHRSLELGQSGRCRFAVAVDGNERVYELHSFPLTLVARRPAQGDEPVRRSHQRDAGRASAAARRAACRAWAASRKASRTSSTRRSRRFARSAADMGAALDAVREATVERARARCCSTSASRRR